MGEFIIGLAIGGVIATLVSSFMYYVVFPKDKNEINNHLPETKANVAMPECKPPKSENIPIREGHELQDYTKIVSVQLLEVLKAEIYNIYKDRPEGYNHRQRTELYNEVQKAIQKHIDDLSGKDNKSN